MTKYVRPISFISERRIYTQLIIDWIYNRYMAGAEGKACRMISIKFRNTRWLYNRRRILLVIEVLLS